MKVTPVQVLDILMSGLMRHVPSGIRVLKHIHNSGLVPDVSVIVKSEKIPVIVKCKFLWIPQSPGKDLKIPAIRIAAKDCSASGFGFGNPIAINHGVSPVPHRKIEHPVGSANNSVQVVSGEGNSHPKTTDNFFIGVRNAIIVFIRKFTESGYAGKVNRVLLSKHRKSYPVQGFIKISGKYFSCIRNPIPVSILQTDQPFGYRGVPIHGNFIGKVLIQLKPVCECVGLKIPGNHVPRPPQILHPKFKSVRFRHKHSSLRIDI